MHRVRIPDLPWEEPHSPAKKFHSFCHNLSLAGDAVLHPPGEAHPLTNTITEDLRYLLCWHLPDSNQWDVRAPRTILRMHETAYWDGEE
jgi:hypothetical protein